MSLTTIDRAPDGTEDVPAMIHRTLDAHETILEKVRAAIDKTEKNPDWGSNDLLVGDVLRRNELQVWFIAKHVVDVPLIEDQGAPRRRRDSRSDGRTRGASYLGRPSQICTALIRIAANQRGHPRLVSKLPDGRSCWVRIS